MKPFEWEKFDDGEPYNTRKRIHVTINSEGKIFFNRKAFESLGSPDGVSLMYDRRRSTIGVTAAKLNEQGAYRLRQKQRKFTGHIISARNFCKRFNIFPDETLAFPAADVNNDGILILDLNDVRSVKKNEKA
jgi:hypothetical protein